MYQINRESNRIKKVQEVSFKDLGFRERDHLQEWLCNCPDALGEELLIIQKEFDGFNETRERLDLLALDKDGMLVIIENKLDDSGRDVVWQSLKYASYCSTLSKSQIVEIFEKHLLDEKEDADARSLISNFLQKDEFDEIMLNSGNDQRIIMVARDFRKEVTSTVLWLMNHGINLKCFRATPFSLDANNVFLNLEQVIPIKDAEEFMINMAAKEQEKKTINKVKSQRGLICQEFWQQTLAAFQEAQVSFYKNQTPPKTTWMSLESGITSISYEMAFAKKYLRAELYLKRKTLEENKLLYDFLYAKKENIESRFGFPLELERLDSRKACRIKYEQSFDGNNKENWPEMGKWFVVHIKLFEATFKSEISELWDSLKSQETS